MKRITLIILLLPAILLAACQNASAAPAAAQDVSTPISTTAPAGSRTLTVCLAYEPESLYLYAASSQAARDVLQAVYDGPFNEIDGEIQPVILKNLPEVTYTQINAQAGDRVVNVHGQVVSLQTGTRVFPSGCRQSDCMIEWDGSSALLMDQPHVTFQLRDGLTWSDGQPLTAADSVYSYTLASDPATPNDKTSVEQTAGYAALDETTLLWTGLPGLVTDSYTNYFWSPLPQHAWGAYSASELLTAETAARSPLGWGAYMLDEWKAGEYIRLVKNPFYFRADEGLPKFDVLLFKITDGYGDTNLANLKFEREPYAQFKYDLGEYQAEVDQYGCDLVSTTVDMTDQLNVLNILLNYFSDPAVKVAGGSGKQAAWLLFNRRSGADGAATLFDSLQMRQATAACLERGELADAVFHNLVQIPDAFTFDGNDSPAGPNAALSPDPARGRTLLEENGWQAGEARTALNVAGIPDGTALSLNYLTVNDSLSLAAAQQVQASLTQCGFQVNITAVPAQVYWDKNAPESVFQGKWDMAQINWELPLENPCPLFASAAIPGAENDFAGLNFSAFADDGVDAICSQLEITTLSADRQALLDELQAILDQDLAVIPLYTYANLMVSRDDLCDFKVSSASELAGIESFDYGAGCLP